MDGIETSNRRWWNTTNLKCTLIVAPTASIGYRQASNHTNQAPQAKATLSAGLHNQDSYTRSGTNQLSTQADALSEVGSGRGRIILGSDLLSHG